MHNQSQNLMTEKQVYDRMSYNLKTLLNNIDKLAQKKICIVCIGTDRVTGDALGPLVGTFITTLSTNTKKVIKISDHESKHEIVEYNINDDNLGKIQLLGTIEYPVTAVNLHLVKDYIYKIYHNPAVIAVDACLSKANNVGNLSVRNGPLIPGAGVSKKLQPIGDIAITGAVNVGGFMENVVLANTRLLTVMNLAQSITGIIMDCLEEINKSKHSIQPSSETLYRNTSISNVFVDVCRQLINRVDVPTK